MLVLVTTHATHATLNKITCLTQKSTPNTISLSYSTTMLFRPTNPCAKKLPSKFYFEFLYSIFFFLPPTHPPPPWVSIFCLPADEATAKSVKNSPTDSEKQTAVASKDKGNFF